MESIDTKPKLAAASIGAAIVAALVSSLCCIGPLALAALGLGGAGLLVKAEAYRPCLAAVTLGLLGAGFHLTSRRRRPSGPSAPGNLACDCPVPTPHRPGRVALWVATVVVAVLLAFPYLAGTSAEGISVAGSATTTLRVEGMPCASCKDAVRTALLRLDGVKDARVDETRKSATVEYDASKVTPPQLVDAVNRLGFQASLPAKSGS